MISVAVNLSNYWVIKRYSIVSWITRRVRRKIIQIFKVHYYGLKLNKLSVFLLLLINSGIFNFIEAQSNDNVSKQIWIDVNPSYSGYSGLEFFGDAGLRKEIENDGWMRIVLRPSARIPIGKQFFFAAGLGNFLQ